MRERHPWSWRSVGAWPEAGKCKRRFLQRWAGAWSARDIETYLASYADDFSPSDDLSRMDWEEQRHNRLRGSGFIKVELNDLEIEKLSKNRARVKAVQNYRSDRYSDRVLKQFDLIEKGGRWLILREKVLGTIN